MYLLEQQRTARCKTLHSTKTVDFELSYPNCDIHILRVFPHQNDQIPNNKTVSLNRAIKSSEYECWLKFIEVSEQRLSSTFSRNYEKCTARANK
ncbi:hypothetical protein ACTXT7_006886 [Hymenolepis weldensis]